MARAIHWQVQFMSLKGISCHVDVYEEGYTGDVVTLQGGGVPFEFQEDDDYSMLNCVRSKTGYLRVIEESGMNLTAMYPTTDTEEYVEAYYGDECVFVGYIQAQSFSQNYENKPRELEFPVISPLGLLENFNFDAITTAGLVSVKDLLLEVLNGLNGGYTKVVIPSKGYLDYQLNSLIISPYNGDFNASLSESDLYDPVDYRTFIEGLCNCFGWIAREQGTSLIFQCNDKTGSYNIQDASTLDDAGNSEHQSQQIYPLSDYFTFRDNEGEWNGYLPMKSITVKAEGESPDKEGVDYEHILYAHDHSLATDSNMCVAFMPASEDIMSGIAYPVFDSGGKKLSDTGTHLLDFGSYGTNDRSCNMEQMLVAHYTSWGSEFTIFKRKFTIPPISTDHIYLLKASVKVGDDLESLAEGGDFYLNFIIQQGDKYLITSSGEWTSEYGEYLNAIKFDNEGKIDSSCLGHKLDYRVKDWDGLLFKSYNNSNAPITIEVRCNTAQAPGKPYVAIDFSLQKAEYYYSDYVKLQSIQTEKTIALSATGKDTESVNMAFNAWTINSATILDANGVYVSATLPTYGTLAHPSHTLRGKFKATSNSLDYLHLYKFSYAVKDWFWRIIGHSFNLRDDDITLTILHSSTF